MSRQYFADFSTEPLGTASTTIIATTETVLIPTALTPIGANEARAGKVWELIVGGTCTTGTAGTLILTPRFGTTISGVSIGVSPTQNYVPSVTAAPFIFKYYLVCTALGQPGTNSTFKGTGFWQSNGAVATAASCTSVLCGGAGSSACDASIASALWIGVTFSVIPSVIPMWHKWGSLN